VPLARRLGLQHDGIHPRPRMFRSGGLAPTFPSRRRAALAPGTMDVPPGSLPMASLSEAHSNSQREILCHQLLRSFLTCCFGPCSPQVSQFPSVGTLKAAYDFTRGPSSASSVQVAIRREVPCQPPAY
jgi:hypothetical protein